MIEIVDGKGVGAGKSYYVLTRLKDHLIQGKTAYVSESFVLKFDKLAALCETRHGVVIEPDQYHIVKADDVRRLHEVTPPGTPGNEVLLVLDEVQDQLNARDWGDKDKRELFSWCCQSRHDDNDLIFISQSSQNIDKQVKRLTTFIWHIRNSCKTPIMGVGRLDVLIKTLTLGMLDGKYFIANQLDQDGRTIMSRKWIRHDPALFDCYESKSMRMTRKRSGSAVLKKSLKRSKKGNPVMLRWVILLSVGAFGFLGFKIIGRFSGMHDKKPQHEVAAHATDRAVVMQAAPAYQIIRERLLSRSPGWMSTESEDYEPGHLTSQGWCEGIDGNVARIRTPNGVPLYVIGVRGNGEHHTNSQSVPISHESAKTPNIVVAPNSGIMPIVDEKPKKEPEIETNLVPHRSTISTVRK